MRASHHAVLLVVAAAALQCCVRASGDESFGPQDVDEQVLAEQAPLRGRIGASALIPPSVLYCKTRPLAYPYATPRVHPTPFPVEIAP